MSAVSPETILARSESLAWRVLEGEAVILYPEEGTLHRLNESGTRVWEQLDGARTLGDIGNGLTDEYEVVATDAVHDLCDLADELVSAGLVEVRG